MVEFNKSLCLYKAFYFFYYSSFMLRLIYTPVYFKELGLSPSYAGIISGASAFSRAFGGLGLCYVADKTNLKKTIFLISLFAFTVTPLMVTLPQPGNRMCPPKEKDPSNLMPVSSAYLSRKLGSNVERNNDLKNGSKPTFDGLTLKQSGQGTRNYTAFLEMKSLLKSSSNKSFLSDSSQPSDDKDSNIQENAVAHFVKYFMGFLLGYHNSTDQKSERMTNNNDTSLDKENISDFAGQSLTKGITRVQFSNRTEEENHDDKTLQESKEMMYLFVCLFLITVAGDVLSGPSRNLADAATMFVLEGDKASYGTVRLWSNVGQILLVTGMSIAVYLTKIKICGTLQDDYKLSLYTLSAGMAIAFLIGTQFHFSSPEEKKETENQRGPTVKDIIALTKASWNWLILLVFWGAFEGVFSAFLFWYILTLGSTHATIIVGVANIMRNVSALLVFMVSPYFIRKAGALNTMNLTIVLYVVTFLICSVISNPWLGIIPEFLQSAAFAFMASSSVYFFSETANANIASTAQGLLTMFMGIGQCLGPVVGGFIVVRVGLRTNFLIFAGLSCCLLLFSVAVQVVQKYKDNNREYKPISAQEEEDFESLK